uniref:WRKY-like protein n=1 Tax=Hypericum perforatum TaxID=65561 RepID=D9ZHC5_HYPPE|nr:WRKY-like protein [Hypericum perforatum]
MTSSVRPVSPGRESVEKVSDEVSNKRKSMDRGTQTIPETPNSKVYSAQNQQEKTSSVSPEKPLQGSDSGVRISQLDKEGSISSITPSKLPQTPTRGSNGLPSVPEGRSPIIREKVSEDGFHWRKYGQKFVRGNEFVRSYYRCTHPSCPVKKQLECSLDGQIADIVYFGQHDHPKPEVTVPVPVGFLLSVVEEKHENAAISKATEVKVKFAPPLLPVLSGNNSQISTVTSSEDVRGVLSETSKTKDEVCNDHPISKRQKKSAHDMDPNPEDNPTGETRVVVQTVSEVDIVNDGYRWRKYGQKMVKGNPNPRSYYRCSYPGCPVKKHVERASHDPKVVLTSYEGQHEHNIPQSRTVTHNASGQGTSIQHSDRGSGVVSLEVADISGLEPARKLKEKPDGKLETKVKAVDNVSSDAVVPANKPNGKQNGKSDVKDEISAAEVVDNSSVSVSASELKEKDNGRPKAESNENGSSCNPDAVTGNKQHVPIAGPVQS